LADWAKVFWHVVQWSVDQLVKMDDALAMAVLPASYHVDLTRLKAAAGANTIAVATEREFRSQFPDCETGAMPPFGNLYGIPVYVDETLTDDEEIAFNAGSHHELIRLPYADFERLVGPEILSFSSVHAGMAVML